MSTNTAPCALPDDAGEIERVAHGLGELANTFSYFEHERRAFAEWEKICRNTAAKLKEREARIAEMERALKEVAGGCFPDASTLVLAGDWHGAYGRLQEIARRAILSPKPPSEPTHD